LNKIDIGRDIKKVEDFIFASPNSPKFLKESNNDLFLEIG